ncbi:MAG TPA: lipoprotein insertase outer membrane protein LolB [Steroidobacteraceae bacterium]|nr:lipoprotein insertase outer membrane protein LolB [Steroidobacteraceae bacterium]
MRAALALALAVLLAGCAAAPPRPTAQMPWPERRARLQALDPYELAGRVAVAAGSEGFSAHLTWHQQGARSTLELNGALGIGGLHVIADGETLDVQTSKGERLESDQARAELQGKLGFEPPLASLRYWLVGVPDPGRPAIETVGSDQRLAGLVQDDWQIAYTDYLEANGYSLPRHLTLRRGDVRVRVVVYRWQPRTG